MRKNNNKKNNNTNKNNKQKLFNYLNKVRGLLDSKVIVENHDFVVGDTEKDSILCTIFPNDKYPSALSMNFNADGNNVICSFDTETLHYTINGEGYAMTYKNLNNDHKLLNKDLWSVFEELINELKLNKLKLKDSSIIEIKPVKEKKEENLYSNIKDRIKIKKASDITKELQEAEKESTVEVKLVPVVKEKEISEDETKIVDVEIIEEESTDFISKLFGTKDNDVLNRMKELIKEEDIEAIKKYLSSKDQDILIQNIFDNLYKVVRDFNPILITAEKKDDANELMEKFISYSKSKNTEEDNYANNQLAKLFA